MPPLESRPGSYYSTTSDSDYESLMSRAVSGEFDVIEAQDETGQKTYLFAPSTEADDSDLIPHAMMEGILRGVAFGNRIVSEGKEI